MHSRLACSGTIALLATAAIAPGSGASAQQASLAGNTCTVREVSRTPLVVEGAAELAVDARTFSRAANGDALIAGRTLLYKRAGHSAPVLVAADSVLGAVLGKDGTARTIPFPITSHRIQGLTAAPRAGGGWDVAFAEMRGDPRPSALNSSDTVSRLWHGVYDGTRWSALEKLPSWPDSIQLWGRASTLAYHGDSLGWALAGRTRRWGRVVAVFERANGEWSYELLGVSGGAYVALRYTDQAVLQLALVSPDSSIPRPGSDQNSLFVWERRPRWQMARRLVLGGREGPVDFPVLAGWRGHTVLSWVQTPPGSGRKAITAVDPLEPSSSPVELDPALSFYSDIASLQLADGHQVWVTNHQGENSNEFWFHIKSGVSAPDLVRLPSPYRGGFLALVPEGSDVLLTGNVSAGEGKPLQSLIIRMRVHCSS